MFRVQRRSQTAKEKRLFTYYLATKEQKRIWKENLSPKPLLRWKSRCASVICCPLDHCYCRSRPFLWHHGCRKGNPGGVLISAPNMGMKPQWKGSPLAVVSSRHYFFLSLYLLLHVGHMFAWSSDQSRFWYSAVNTSFTNRVLWMQTCQIC